MKTLRPAVVFLLLFLLLALGACAENAPTHDRSPLPAAETAEIGNETEPEPKSTPVPVLSLGGRRVNADARVLDLSDQHYSYQLLLENSGAFTSLEEIRLGATGLSEDKLQALRDAFPGVTLQYQLFFNGKEIPLDTETLDLSSMTAGQLDEAIALLPHLHSLRTVNLIPGDACTALTPQEAERLAAAAPEAEFQCRFDLFGKTADADTVQLRYQDQPLGNEAIEVFRAALPFLPSLELLRIQNCEITDYDAMAALRDDFPDRRVVWSVRIGEYDFMTDTTLINAALVLNDNNVHLLQYMPDVLYLDVGHNRSLTNIEFVRYFPKLQVVIITLTNIVDITPLEDCPDLEFLELVSTYISDISVVAGMKKLEYLNLGYMSNLADISPVYGLKQLKQVRICGPTLQHVPLRDIERLKEELPNTFVSDVGGDPTKSGQWRFNLDGSYTERYALLREQMQYDLSDWELTLSNSPSGEEVENRG